MAYLSNVEKNAMEWLTSLSTEAYWQAARLDPLGSLVAALPADASEEVRAWLAYIVAQAPGRGFIVNDYLPEHGTLVLVLPRYVRPKQETFAALESPRESGDEGRQGRQRREQGAPLGTGEQSGESQSCGEEGKDRIDELHLQ